MEYEAGKKVMSGHCSDVVNRAIAIPYEITSDDGRVFHVIDWKAHVPSGNAVTLAITCLVSFPEGYCEQVH